MSDHVYQIMEVVGSSPDGQDQAIRNAITKAQSMVTHMRWFEVKETRGHIADGDVAHFQVTVRVGHTLD